MQTRPPPQIAQSLFSCVHPYYCCPPHVWAMHSPALSDTEFSGVVLLVLVTLGPTQPSLSPLPDVYPHMVIFCSFLRAGRVLDYAMTML